MAPCDENFYYSCTDCSRIFINKITFQFHQKAHQEDKLLAFVNRRRPRVLLTDIGFRIRREDTNSGNKTSAYLSDISAKPIEREPKEQRQGLVRPVSVFVKGPSSRVSRNQWGMHKCLQCGIIFNKEINLRLHKQKKHATKSPFNCSVCGKKFLSKIRLQSHQASHPPSSIRSSKMPELEYNNGSDFNNSSSSASQPPDLNPEGESSQTSNDTADGDSFETCLDCGDAIGVADLFTHISTHIQPGQSECFHCDFHPSHPRDLIDHMTVHYGLKTYACQLQKCGKAYHWKHSLARHIATNHPSANAFECGSCDASFATLREERRHALTHVTDGEGISTDTMTVLSEDGDQEKKKSVGPYECGQCHALFAKKKQLKAHESIHKRRSQAEIQQQHKPSFIGMSGLRRVHQQPVVYSKPRRKKNNESNSVVSESDRRSCKTCGQEMMLSDLLIHIRTHITKDQRQCDLCQHVYANVESLREHMHTHYALEPHKCTICHKTYSLKQSVLNHIIRNHKAAKPLEYYTCMIPPTPKIVKEAPIVVPKKPKNGKVNGNGILNYPTGGYVPSPLSIYGGGSSSSSLPQASGFAIQQMQHSNHNSPLNSRSATPSTSSENGASRKPGLKPIAYECNFCSRVFTTKFSVQRHEAKLHNYVESDHKRYYKTTYAAAEDSSDAYPMDQTDAVALGLDSWLDGKLSSDALSNYNNRDVHEHKYESLRTEIHNLLLQQDRCASEFMFKEIPANLY